MLRRTANGADSLPGAHIVQRGNNLRLFIDSSKPHVPHAFIVRSSDGALRMDSSGRITRFAADGTTNPCGMIEERMFQRPT